MTLSDGLALVAAVMLLVTGAVHSWGGEKFLFGPMFRQRGNRVLENPLARMVLRFAWHLTTLTWVILAAILVATVVAADQIGQVARLGVGSSFLAVGLFDMVASKGKHIGWPLLLLVGILALAAEYLVP